MYAYTVCKVGKKISFESCSPTHKEVIYGSRCFKATEWIQPVYDVIEFVVGGDTPAIIIKAIVMILVTDQLQACCLLEIASLHRFHYGHRAQ